MATEASAAETHLRIEEHIEQVQDGRQYKGYLKIGGKQFDYDFMLGIPLSEFEKMSEEELLKRKNEFRQLFLLTVKRNDAIIELTDEEHRLFCSILMHPFEKLYKDSRTRAFNESPLMGAALPGGGLLESKGTTVSMSMTSTVAYIFSPEICEMLRVPKFDCTF